MAKSPKISTYSVACQLQEEISDELRSWPGEVVGSMKFYFDNLAYKLWLQDIMKEFVLTVRPGTNKWYLSYSPL